MLCQQKDGKQRRCSFKLKGSFRICFSTLVGCESNSLSTKKLVANIFIMFYCCKLIFLDWQQHTTTNSWRLIWAHETLLQSLAEVSLSYAHDLKNLSWQGLSDGLKAWEAFGFDTGFSFEDPWSKEKKSWNLKHWFPFHRLELVKRCWSTLRCTEDWGIEDTQSVRWGFWIQAWMWWMKRVQGGDCWDTHSFNTSGVQSSASSASLQQRVGFPQQSWGPFHLRILQVGHFTERSAELHQSATHTFSTHPYKDLHSPQKDKWNPTFWVCPKGFVFLKATKTKNQKSPCVNHWGEQQ